MSKATFYEHFSNKEEAILALFEMAQTVMAQRIADAMEAADDPESRIRAGLYAFVETVAEFPAASQTLLVEIIGAGPRAIERRDAIVEQFARLVDEENKATHERFGTPRLKSFEDAVALVGAMVELASRHVRLGSPADARDLEPSIERLILGLLAASGG